MNILQKFIKKIFGRKMMKMLMLIRTISGKLIIINVTNAIYVNVSLAQLRLQMNIQWRQTYLTIIYKIELEQE